MAAAVASGGHPDPRDAQIARLRAGNAALTTRCAQQDQAIAALQDLRTLTLSRLAAQHDEIQRLRAAARKRGNAPSVGRCAASEHPRSKTPDRPIGISGMLS